MLTNCNKQKETKYVYNLITKVNYKGLKFDTIFKLFC